MPAWESKVCSEGTGSPLQDTVDAAGSRDGASEEVCWPECVDILQRRLHDDMVEIVRGECQVMRNLLEKGLQRIEQSQMRACPQFASSQPSTCASCNGSPAKTLDVKVTVGDMGPPSPSWRPREPLGSGDSMAKVWPMSPSVNPEHHAACSDGPGLDRSNTPPRANSPPCSNSPPGSFHRSNSPRDESGPLSPVGKRPQLGRASMMRSLMTQVPNAGNSCRDMVALLQRFASTIGSKRLNRIFQSMADWLYWWGSLREPCRTGLVESVIVSRPFEFVCVSILLANGVFIAYATDYEIGNLDGGPPSFMTALDACFLVFYTFELCLRIFVHRWYFFCNQDMRWNLFDLLLVAFSILDLAKSHLLTDGESQGGRTMVFFRLFRLFKVAKVLRLVRALRFFQELRLMVDCVLNSFSSLFWCLTLIGFMLYMFSLIFVQGMTQHLKDVGQSMTHEERQSIMETVGSVGRAALSLYKCVTGGMDWGDTYDLIEPVGVFEAGCFIFFIAFFCIAAWNIITSTFIEKAFKLAQPDIDSMVLEKRRKDLQDAAELTEFFKRIDIDGSRGISLEEFTLLVDSSELGLFLEMKGIDIKDAKMFFALLMSGSEGGEVDLNTFVSNCLRMTGLATSIDLHTMGFEMRTLHVRQQRLLAELSDHLVKLELIEPHAGQPVVTTSSGHFAASPKPQHAGVLAWQDDVQALPDEFKGVLPSSVLN